MPGHRPVLLSAVLSSFQLKPGQTVIDATVGGGGHAGGMLAKISPGGRLLGLEADSRTVPIAQAELQPFGPAVSLVQTNFRHLQAVAIKHGFMSVDAILFDLGLSSMTVDDPARGFSFQATGPLDMRFDPTTQTTTAADLVNHGSAEDLTKIFRSYGQETAAARVAAAIVARRDERPFNLTTDLAETVASVIPRRGPRHPATKVFQALRMAVNDELGALQSALPQALELLKPGGVMAVIAFHSLEDRLVKNWIKDQAARKNIEIITKHPIRPDRTEQLDNPRSRSAKLRVARKN